MTQKALEGLEGVDSVKVVYHSGNRGSVRFQYRSKKTNVTQLQKALEKVNPLYRVVMGSPEHVPLVQSDIDYRVVSSRNGFDLALALPKEKKAIVLFLEKEGWEALRWETKAEPFAQEYHLAVRVIFLSDSVSRKQFDREWNGKELPLFVLYDEKGKCCGSGRSFKALRSLLP